MRAKRATRIFSPSRAIFSVIRSLTRLSVSRNGQLQQADRLEPLVQLALHDLRHAVRRPAIPFGLLGEAATLLLEHLGGHVVAAHPARREPRHLHRQLARELLEVISARHEIGLAVELQQDPQARAMVDVAGDHAFADGAARLLGSDREALVAEPGDRLLDVSGAVLEGPLAVHDAGPGLLAEALHVLGSDHRESVVPSCVWTAATSGKGRVFVRLFLGRLGGSPRTGAALLLLVLLRLGLEDERLATGERGAVVGVGHQGRVVDRRQCLCLLELLVEAGLALGVRLEHRVRDPGTDQPDGSDRVIVGGDHPVDLVRVAVGIGDRNDRDLEAAGLEHGDRLAVRVDDEDRPGQASHAANARRARRSAW